MDSRHLNSIYGGMTAYIFCHAGPSFTSKVCAYSTRYRIKCGMTFFLIRQSIADFYICHAGRDPASITTLLFLRYRFAP